MRSRVARAKAVWSSRLVASFSKLSPTRSSTKSRHRSTTFSIEAGGRSPVSASRSIIATACSSGASARSVTSAKEARWNFSSSMA